METYTSLTAPLTEACFIVAYVDSASINMSLIPKLAEVIDDIYEQWRIDKDKFFFAGHSDGGIIAQTFDFFPDIEFKIGIQLADFVSSASGLQKNDLQEYACTVQASQSMILHNLGDKYFVNIGKGVAQWWAQ